MSDYDWFTSTLYWFTSTLLHSFNTYGKLTINFELTWFSIMAGAFDLHYLLRFRNFPNDFC